MRSQLEEIFVLVMSRYVSFRRLDMSGIVPAWGRDGRRVEIVVSMKGGTHHPEHGDARCASPTHLRASHSTIDCTYTPIRRGTSAVRGYRYYRAVFLIGGRYRVVGIGVVDIVSKAVNHNYHYPAPRDRLDAARKRRKDSPRRPRK